MLPLLNELSGETDLNSKYHAGWMVCPYVQSGFCPVAKGIIPINIRTGGTNKFGSHFANHAKENGEKFQIARDLKVLCSKYISRAAAMAVTIDLRSISFADNHTGVAAFAKAIFEAGQGVTCGVPINCKSYLSSKNAMGTALIEIGVELRSKFREPLKFTLMILGGTVTVD